MAPLRSASDLLRLEETGRAKAREFISLPPRQPENPTSKSIVETLQTSNASKNAIAVVPHLIFLVNGAKE